MPFVELSTLTNFTFLTGASHPEEMMLRAGEMGMPALAVADVNSVAGIVRAHTKARELARDGGAVVRLIPAARIVLADGFQVTVLPRDRAAWGRLCRMLSLGQLRAPKGECRLELSDLLDWGQGMEMLVLPPDQRLTLAVVGDTDGAEAVEGASWAAGQAVSGAGQSGAWPRAMTGRTGNALPG